MIISSYSFTLYACLTLGPQRAQKTTFISWFLPFTLLILWVSCTLQAAGSWASGGVSCLCLPSQYNSSGITDTCHHSQTFSEVLESDPGWQACTDCTFPCLPPTPGPQKLFSMLPDFLFLTQVLLLLHPWHILFLHFINSWFIPSFLLIHVTYSIIPSEGQTLFTPHSSILTAPPPTHLFQTALASSCGDC